MAKFIKYVIIILTRLNTTIITNHIKERTNVMLTITTSNATQNFDKLCNYVIQNHKPTIIVHNDNNNVVLIPQTDYNGLVKNLKSLITNNTTATKT